MNNETSGSGPTTGKYRPLIVPASVEGFENHDQASAEYGSTERLDPTGRPDLPIFMNPSPAESPERARGQNEPPLYLRSPRNYIPAPDDEIEIQRPLSPEGRPTSSLLTMFLPLGLSMAGLVLSVMLISSNNVAYLALSLPMMIGSAVVGVISYIRERKRYKENKAKREEVYHQYLSELRQRLDRLVRRQGDAGLTANPAPGECMRRVTARDSRLWERGPQAPDFLSVRLGTGTLPASFKIRVPEKQQSLEEDPLLAEAIALGSAYREISHLPVQLPLGQVGVSGAAGPREELITLMRSVLIQLSTHHSPAEVKVILLVPEAETHKWSWARWLPHLMGNDRHERFLRATPESAHQLLVEFSRVLQERKSLLDGNGLRDSSQRAPTLLPALVFVFADSAMWSGMDQIGGAMIHQLTTEGPSLGAYSIFMADSPQRLHQSCRAVVEVGLRHGMMKFIGSQPVQYSFQMDALPLDQADAFARAMAPLRLQRQVTASAQDLPKMVTILDVLGAHRVEDLRLLEQWQQHYPEESMAAPVGILASGDRFELNLQDASKGGHGSHGLVAGGTGSGKTEFIQSMVLAMAARFHPHEVAFALVDFKGGDMIAPLRKLPHVLSEITNLEIEEVPRALVSLEAEINRRETIFEQLRRSQKLEIRGLDDYMALRRKGRVDIDLPYLIIVVDEFTVLKQTRPEDMDRFITIAVKGRSAGVRMILATQNPTGVVSGQVDANTRLRVCLRVNQKEHSTDILKRPDAAALKNPGSAYIKVGEGELFELIQSAYTGAVYDPDDHRAIYLGPDMNWVSITGQRALLQENRRVAGGSDKPSQIQAIVEHIRSTAEANGIQPLRGPWLAPLPEKIYLPAVPQENRLWTAAGWQEPDGQQPDICPLRPCIGLYDNPTRQEQGALALDFALHGHLAVIGAPGTGKTTLLQTLVSALAAGHTPERVNFYLLDFGGRSLTIFNDLPHTGAVVMPDESERMGRVFGLFLEEMEQRKRLLGQLGLNSIEAYRRQNSAALPAPDLFLIIDNLPALLNMYPETLDSLAALASEGGKLGLHLVITVNANMQLPMKLSTSISMIVCLELNDAGEYSAAVGNTAGMRPRHGVRGSGLQKAAPLPLLFQTALPAAGEDENEISQSLRDQVRAMRAAWSGPCARPVPPLASLITLSDLPRPVTGQPSGCPVTLGREISRPGLDPFTVRLSDGPHFLITGPAVSGKTSLLQTWLAALAQTYTPDQVKFYLASFGDPTLAPFRRLPHTCAWIEDSEGLEAAVDSLRMELDRRKAEMDEARRQTGGLVDDRQFAARWPALVLAFDDFDQLNRSASETGKSLLAGQIKRKGLGFHVLAAGPVGEFTSGWGDLISAIKDLQTGFLLSSSDSNDLSVLNIKLPFGEARGDMPAGRAYFAQKGRFRMVQMATCLGDRVSLHDRLSKIIQVQAQPAAATADGFTGEQG